MKALEKQKKVWTYRLRKTKNTLRTFLGLEPKKLRTSEGFKSFWCSYKKTYAGTVRFVFFIFTTLYFLFCSNYWKKSNLILVSNNKTSSVEKLAVSSHCIEWRHKKFFAILWCLARTKEKSCESLKKIWTVSYLF